MKKFRFFCAAFFIIPGAGVRADVTRDDAIDAVYRLLSPAALDHEAAAYLTMAPLPAGTQIVPFGDENRAVTLTKSVWFAWIDDQPDAFFVHRVRYVFIDAATGKPTSFVQRWWPEVNGVPIFSASAVQAQPELRIFSTRLLKPVTP
jgi:hypothetical protein